MAHVKACPDRIAELAAQGFSQSTIGAILGVSRERIRQICNRDGIATVPGGIDYDGIDRAAAIVATGESMSISELAQRVGVALPTVSGWIRKGWLDAPVEASKKWHGLRECAENGMTLSEAARHCGYTVQAAWGEAQRHGIRFSARYRRSRA